MKISDLFKRDSNVSSLNKEAVEKKNAESAAKDLAGANDDTISISPRARQYRQIANVVNEDDAARSAKVADIKQRVANGSYEVSSENVAKSIVSYISGKDE